ncbi:hypothetical protein [Paenibacillus wynnii]|uniref:hypothetical protein n=1 Tax=Paenibacillus wynnii TaxID=268407 RepID=UPI002791DDA6|nr:hypothetical protein [Paenibacillus wynnii]MDQ0195768.1 hypothetical protein [Paenibacillus wynnii]
MNKKLSILTAAVAIVIGLNAGVDQVFAAATTTESKKLSTITTRSSHAEAVYRASLPLLNSVDQLPKAISYLNNNIYAVSSYRATIMTLKLENAHKVVLSSWKSKFSSSDIQRKLTAVYKPGLSMTQLAEETQDGKLRTLLETAGESGYTLESTKGSFFPVIDYGAYRKYKLYVTDDIRDYISIMAVESDLPSAKDNGLIIAWTEVASRALSQESFIKAYPRSNRVTAVKSLYQMYLVHTFYGLNNTPLFHYDNLEMDLEAQKAYSALLSKREDRTPFLDKLEGFMILLKENGYTLDDAIEQYLGKEVPQGIE